MPATAAVVATSAKMFEKKPYDLAAGIHERPQGVGTGNAQGASVSWATKEVESHLRSEQIYKLLNMRGSRRPTMRKLSLKLFLYLLVFSGPVSAKTEAGWEKYQPGVVEAAISSGKSVLLGYLSTW